MKNFRLVMGVVAATFAFAILVARPIQAVSVNIGGYIPGEPEPQPPGGAAYFPPPLPDTTAPVISSVRVPVVGKANAEVHWDTNEPATSTVEYGFTTAYELGSVTNTSMVFLHQIPMGSLLEGSFYHFRVRSTDASGNTAISGEHTFTTPGIVAEPGDTSLPANVSLFTAIPLAGVPTIALSWVNPADADFNYVVIVRRDDGFPTSPTDGAQIFQGTTMSAQASGLIPGETYYFAAYAVDGAGNVSSGALAQATVAQSITFTVLAKPEKRALERWGVFGILALREPGTLNALDTQPIVTGDNQRAQISAPLGPGVYDAGFKGNGYLRTVLTALPLGVSGSVADFTRGGAYLLQGGDVHYSSDNAVNSLDLSAMLAKISTGFALTDLNADATVNAMDLNILLNNLGERGDS